MYCIAILNVSKFKREKREKPSQKWFRGIVNLFFVGIAERESLSLS